jgi:D-alanine-D-alanine ligase
VSLYNCRTDLPVLLITNLDPSWPLEVIQDYEAETHLLINAMIGVGHLIRDVCIQSADLEMALVGFSPDEYLVFNWCEELPGIPRSEYQVAETLERMGFTFTGSDSSTLFLGQDKNKVKQILQMKRIPTPMWQVLTRADQINWVRFPAIVKAAFEHCSYGITRESVVQSTAELIRRVSYIFDEFHQPALVEEFIDGREFHVGVIGNGALHVLPPAEIDYSDLNDIHDRLCTYEANFDKDSQAYKNTIPKLPASLTRSQQSNLEHVAITAYHATNCRDYARMDIRLRDNVFYVLDVNHNADISSENSMVLGAELEGYSYGQFGSLLVNLAAQRHPKLSTLFQTTEIGKERCLDL